MLPLVLGLAATIAAVSTSVFGDLRADGPAASAPPSRTDGSQLVEDLAVTKFSKLPALTYQLRNGDTLFAWQIKPAIEAQPPRPRDVLILVDTSASQAGRPLQQARRIVTALTGSLARNDRVSLWTINTPAGTKPLIKGFLPANAEELQQAAAELTEVEYGSGATDLKGAMNKALATLPPDRGRQQIVLMLGDGESNFSPLTEDDRFTLGNGMDMRDVFFFAVPLGVKVNPQNLHGLASLTGGAVVRLLEDLDNPVKRGEFIARLTAAFAVPVLKVEKAKFGDEVGEVFPTRLPPLRADRSTLVMGKLAQPTAVKLSLSVSGPVNNRNTTLNFAQAIPAPQVDHFFLNLMVDQWRSAPHKDAPAMLQSDRALALASTQVKLYRDEFLVQANWAISMDRYDDANKLFNAALKIDPTDSAAVTGLNRLEKLMSGKMTKADIQKEISVDLSSVKNGANAGLTVVGNVKSQEPPAPPGPGAPAPPGAAPGLPPDLLQQAEARRRIEDQRYRVLAEATIRRARQLLRTDPDAAYQDLKRQRDDILAYEGIDNGVRIQLAADLEAVMREIFVKGAEVKRQAEAEREAIARTRQRLNEFDRAQDEQARLKNRISMFRQLMQQARFDMAYQEAQLMIQERISRGQTVPVAATASYIIGQQATQLREWRELVRIREDRFLLTLMQTEKSHIPYPDEPPVHFPPASVWRELTSLRREAYLNSNLGPSPTPAQKELKSKVEDLTVEFDPGTNVNDMSLIELLNFLSKKYSLTFTIMEDYFKAESMGDIKEKKPSLVTTNFSGMKLGTFLDQVLVGMNATFIVRPDYIEITTFKRRLEEKVTRVFPVADLVIPIPSSVSQQVLQQNLNVQNSQLAIFGQVLGAQNFLGGGAVGIGGALGVGGLGQQLAGGLGAIGAIGAQGLGGAGAAGQQQAGQFGNFQNNNQGFGGGFTGISGGQLGQFGNLGGQFGLQGGDQSKLLTNLIVETVAKGEWSNVPPQRPLPGMDEEQTFVPAKQLNSLGYYPPARALIIRGTSRYHNNSSVKLESKEGGQAMANPRAPGGPVVISPDSPAPVPDKKQPRDQVAAGGPKVGGEAAIGRDADGKPKMNDPNADPVVLKKLLSDDPKRMWNEAIDWTITDPGVIVACAEFLLDNREYASAVEILKGGMRKGLTTDAWAHESLAIALELSQGSPVEVERAALSAIDLEPTNPKAYIKAAKLEAELKNYDLAISFCKRAAEIEPDQPIAYANALAYAEFASDVKTDAVVWAANNLLRRDWNSLDVDYHKQVNDRLPKLINKFESSGQKADSIRRALAEQTQRDLVIELLWQGSADLDLIVAEPNGSVCSATQKRTTGGGVLKGDLFDQTDGGRSELYTAALAFSGVYKVSVKKVLGRPVGDKASIKVTRFKGTPRESFDLIPIDLKQNRSVEVQLTGGSRTELATVPEESEYRLATTGAPLTTGFSGMGCDFGSPGSLATAQFAGTKPQAMPLVSGSTEARMPGIGANSGDLRASVKVNPDRQTLTLQVNPVFGTGKDVTMPKVPLLPGGE
jgi:tetratricopeptide (TPR) repeat protein